MRWTIILAILATTTVFASEGSTIGTGSKLAYYYNNAYYNGYYYNNPYNYNNSYTNSSNDACLINPNVNVQQSCEQVRQGQENRAMDSAIAVGQNNQNNSSGSSGTSYTQSQTTTSNPGGGVTQSETHSETTAPSTSMMPAWKQSLQPQITTVTNEQNTTSSQSSSR